MYCLMLQRLYTAGSFPPHIRPRPEYRGYPYLRGSHMTHRASQQAARPTSRRFSVSRVRSRRRISLPIAPEHTQHGPFLPPSSVVAPSSRSESTAVFHGGRSAAPRPYTRCNLLTPANGARRSTVCSCEPWWLWHSADPQSLLFWEDRTRCCSSFGAPVSSQRRARRLGRGHLRREHTTRQTVIFLTSHCPRCTPLRTSSAQLPRWSAKRKGRKRIRRTMNRAPWRERASRTCRGSARRAGEPSGSLSMSLSFGHVHME